MIIVSYLGVLYIGIVILDKNIHKYCTYIYYLIVIVSYMKPDINMFCSLLI